MGVRGLRGGVFPERVGARYCRLKRGDNSFDGFVQKDSASCCGVNLAVPEPGVLFFTAGTRTTRCGDYSLQGLLAAGECGEAAEDVFRFGADAEVGVRLGVDDFAVGRDDVSGGQRQLPALVAVDEGDVEEDAAIVALEVFGDGPDEAELVGDGAAEVGEEREGDGVLGGGEVGLALRLGGDADDHGSALAEAGIEGAPGFELGDAVGAPAAAEEIDNEGAEGEEVGGANDFAGEVGQGEGGGLGSGGEDAVLDAGSEELLDRAFTDGEALRLDQVTGLGGDVVELVLEVRHDPSVEAAGRIEAEELWGLGLRWRSKR
jgi:hypothetical protein